MNPRYRRLIIPGLLLGLLVVVIVTAVAREVGAAEESEDSGGAEQVSTLADLRIVESSGLAVSATHDDLAYTVNDSGHDPLVFAVRVSTGETVGVTTLGVDWFDVEALGLDSEGTLWVADIGDNNAVREELRLYALPEPGEGDADIAPDEYRLVYPDGPRDAEAIAVDPADGTVHILTKEVPEGRVFTMPADATPSQVAELVPGPAGLPPLVTDAAFHPDGSAVAVRTYVEVLDVDPETWEIRTRDFLPPQPQGETLAFEPGGDTFLIGSEGEDSALLRLSWTDDDAGHADESAAPSTEPPSGASETGDARPAPLWLFAIAAIGVGSMLVVGFVWNRRR